MTTKKTKIKWEDPPGIAGRIPGTKYLEIVEELRRNPGRWAMIGNFDPSMATNIKEGRISAFRPHGSFEAMSRNTQVDGDGHRRADIYARYVGDGEKY